MHHWEIVQHTLLASFPLDVVGLILPYVTFETMVGHTDQVEVIRISLCGTWLFSTGRDATVRQWSTKTTRLLKTYYLEKEHHSNGPLYQLVVLRNSFITVSEQGALCRWSIETGDLLQVVPMVIPGSDPTLGATTVFSIIRHLAWNPSCASIQGLDHQGVLTWPVAAANEEISNHPHYFSHAPVRCGPDFLTVAPSGQCFVIHNTRNEHRIDTVCSDMSSLVDCWEKHIYAMAISRANKEADVRLFVSAGQRLWITTLRRETFQPTRTRGRHFYQLVLSPDQRYLFARSFTGFIAQYQIQANQLILWNEFRVSRGRTSPSLLVSPDSRFLYFSCNSEILRWSISDTPNQHHLRYIHKRPREDF